MRRAARIDANQPAIVAALRREFHKAGIRVRRHKYNAVKVKADGYTFDSKAEYRRYKELKLLEQSGDISALEVHPVRDIKINGQKVCRVVMDFAYRELPLAEDARYVVEDVKGRDLPMSRLKRKMFEADTGIKVSLVRYR